MRSTAIACLSVLALAATGCGPECGEIEIRDDSDWPQEWEAKEWEVLKLVNQRRAEGANCGGEWFGPAVGLTANPALRKAARHHSMNMATAGFFDHTDPTTRSRSRA